MDSDAASTKKRLAKVGLKYYEGNHDINNYRIFFFDADGKLQEDKTKSNIRISHPFFKLLTDQQAQYMLSAKDGFVKSDIPELQTELDAYFNENESFAAELYELLVGCISKGFEYMYAYKGENDRTAFQTADSIGVVEVREKETDDGCAYVIYWYIERIGKDNKKIKRIQVWDNTQTVFYCQEDDGKIELDKSVEINPRPHILYKKDGDESTYYEDYGLIPFFRLDNGKKQVSGVKPIKDLIDDYDLMNAGLSNNIQDTNEALYVVRGFQGDNLDELMLNIKAKKHIGVDEEGGVDIKTVDIPVEARKTKMEVDESNIYRFGMGFNSAQVGDGNITNVVIKSRYALLDMKCDGLLPSLKQFMRKLLKLVLKEINDTQGTDYTQNDVYFDFTREIITNEQDNAQIKLIEAQEQQARITTLLNLSAQIGNEVLMEQVCDVLDLDSMPRR
jgi:SPP1 family phage portal protein